jgi:hypothetical protein
MTKSMRYLILKDFLRHSGSWNYSRSEFSYKTKKHILKIYGKFCAGNIPNFTCEKTGRELKHYAIDHIIPSRAGGPPTFTNAQILCLDCHAEKSILENEIFPKANSRTSYDRLRAKTWLKDMLNNFKYQPKF